MDVQTAKKLIGINIKKYRHKLGLTQTQLGKRVNIDQRQVAYIENGHSFPSLTTLLKLSTELDCDLKSFFEFDTEGEQKNLKAELTQKILNCDNRKIKICCQLLDLIETNT